MMLIAIRNLLIYCLYYQHVFAIVGTTKNKSSSYNVGWVDFSGSFLDHCGKEVSELTTESIQNGTSVFHSERMEKKYTK